MGLGPGKYNIMHMISITLGARVGKNNITLGARVGENNITLGARQYFPLPVVNERVVLARNRFYSNMHFNPEFVDTLGDKINKLDEMSAAEVEAFIDTTYKIVLSKEPASSAQTGWMKFKRIPIPQVWNKWVAMQIRNEYDAANGVASPERGSPYSRPSGNRSSGYGSPSGNRR